MKESCENIGSENEAQAFAAMLNKLLTKHNLEMSDIEWKKEQNQEPTRRDWFSGKRKTYGWEVMLARIIAEANYCKILAGRGYIVFVGQKSGVDTSAETMKYMHAVADKIATKEYQIRYAKCYAEGNEREMYGYRASFLISFVARLKERLADQKFQIIQENNVSGCTTLMRLDEATKIADEGVKKWGSKNTVSRKANTNNKLGVEDGRKRANTINIGGKQLG